MQLTMDMDRVVQGFSDEGLERYAGQLERRIDLMRRERRSTAAIQVIQMRVWMLDNELERRADAKRDAERAHGPRTWFERLAYRHGFRTYFA